MATTSPSRLAPKYSFRVFSGKSTPSDQPTVTVEVPEGYLIVGGGATTNWHLPEPGNPLVSCFPTDSRHWFAASEAHSVSSPATLTAYAIAIKDDGNLDVKFFSAKSPQSDAPSASIAVDPGYAMTGGGAEVNTTGVGLLLTACYPVDIRTWAARGKAHSVSSYGTITAYAIGLKTLHGPAFPAIKIYSASGGFAEDPQAIVQIGVGCDLIGGGALVEPIDPTIGNLLVRSIPVPSGWSAQSKDHNVVCPAKITAFALAIKQGVFPAISDSETIVYAFD